MKNILEVKNLSKKYAGFELGKVSFDLPRGMVMGFIGENGAGKTTTIKVILNIIRNYEGEIKIFGLDNRKDEAEIKEEVGVVLDEAFFPEILTAGEVGSILKDVYKNWDAGLYERYLDDFNLPKNQPIKKLSKGMRKKLEIATALAHRPKLLILDEPTSGLDPIARNEVIEIFREFIQDEERAIFLSSHITTDLEQIADYITFIHEGEILLTKTCDELLEKYGVAKCTEAEFRKIDRKNYVRYKKTKYAYEVLVEDKREFSRKYKVEAVDKITLEELMFLMVKGER